MSRELPSGVATSLKSFDETGLAAALQHNTALAEKAHTRANEPYQFKIDGLNRSRFLTHKGKLLEKTIDRPRRNLIVNDLDSFAAAMRKHAVTDKDPSVWHAGGIVRGVLDGEWRDEFVSFSLTETAACKQLGKLGNQVWLQKELISLLKTDLKGTGLDEALLLPLRAVNFVTHEDAGGVVQAQAHSFGTAVERKVANLPDDFPEQLLATFAWWNVGQQVRAADAPRPLSDEDHDAPASEYLDTVVAVRVAIEIDFVKKGFWLRPLADDLHRAGQHAQRQLHLWLEEQLTHIPTFHGTP